MGIQDKQLSAMAFSDPGEGPKWRKMMVRSVIPDGLNKLRELIYNLWCCWNPECDILFRMIDEEKWDECGHNPVRLFESLSYQQMLDLEKDEDFTKKLGSIYDSFKNYMNKPVNFPDKPIAYFSMEYGLTDNIMIYSGGLGVLAGDYLKEASDNQVNMVAVGILYRYGYFSQTISLFGDQVSEYHRQRFSKMPISPVFDHENKQLKLALPYPGRTVYAIVWRLDVGKIPLYLLDTDIADNKEEDRFITHQLYGGDRENRLKQEILLGHGGIRLLNVLNIEPSIYHCNEGHAAFITLERLKNNLTAGYSMDEASEIIRSSTLFTTHTPVAAGHDTFHEEVLRPYFEPFAKEILFDWKSFMGLGKIHPDNPDEEFSMSHLAARLSQEINGVSKLHGEVTRKMFSKLYPGYFPDELHIGHVTNGVHYHTWTAPQWQALYKNTFGEEFLSDQSNSTYWEKIYEIPDEKIANIRNQLKEELVNYLRDRVKNDLARRQEDPRVIYETTEKIQNEAFIVGFARRFATYKRGYLLFTHLERLAKLVNMENKPVIFVFAGKAHPHDQAGQDVIKHIMEVSRKPEFLGKVIFLENYNMDLAKKLVQGVDLWFNTPTRQLEASGTSGQKAIFNGVLNFSVLDGWWSEGYKSNAGWALPDTKTYVDQDKQNILDAEHIYTKFEDEIVPLYFKQDDKGLNKEWINKIKNSIAGIAPHYTVKRMIDDYKKHFYQPLLKQNQKLKKDDNALLRKIAQWKRQIIDNWTTIECVAVDFPDSEQEKLNIGDPLTIRLSLKTNAIEEASIGVEVVFRQNINDEEERKIVSTEKMKVVGKEGDIIHYVCETRIENAGVYDFGIRVYPENDELPHRQDLNLVKWV